MATSFMSNLRKPKSLGRWAPTGEIRAGESDPYSWAKDMMERERRDEMAGWDDPVPRSRRGNVGRLGASMSNPDWGGTTNSGMRPMDVVYDQRPEMFEKQLKFQKDQAAQRQKNIEAERIVDSLAANDDYIQNRRNNELKAKQVETADFTARNLKPGELGEREKMQIDFNNRHALETAKSVNDWVSRREANAGSERVANIRGGDSNQNAQTRADAMLRANTDKNEILMAIAKLKQGEGGDEAAAPVTDAPPRIEKEIFDANAAELQGFMGDDDLRRKMAANQYGTGNVPKVGGVGSAGLGGQLGAAGLRGNAPIDANATATPWTKNTSSSSPTAGGGGQVMRKTQKNARTGATRTLISRDGGNTWQPE